MTLRIVVSASTPRNTPRRTSDIRRHSDGLKEAGEKYSATASQASLMWCSLTEMTLLSALALSDLSGFRCTQR